MVFNPSFDIRGASVSLSVGVLVDKSMSAQYLLIPLPES